MILLNPWAWLGLAALAAPIAAHLLARRQATRQLFPTLRFLPRSRVAPVRRDRLTDLALLALRCAVIAVAVGALSQPAWPRRADSAQSSGETARAIIIDTSASMTRETAPGLQAVDAARREAANLAASATISRTIESPTPAEAVAASVNWLSTASMRRELVIVSDFQRGQLEPGDLSAVHAGTGVKTVQIAVQGELPTAPAASASAPSVAILAGEEERTGADAAWHAAIARGAPAVAAPDRPVAIVFPRYHARGTPGAAAKPLVEPWMFDVIAAVASDPLSYLYGRQLSWTGGDVSGRDGVLLIADVPADSLAAAALMTAAARAAAQQPTSRERVHDVVAADELARWSRDAAPDVSRPAADVAPQGWWLWAAVLGLLLIEGVVRRYWHQHSQRGASWTRRVIPPSSCARSSIASGVDAEESPRVTSERQLCGSVQPCCSSPACRAAPSASR